MSLENINQEFRLKKIGEIRNYLIEEINQNKLMTKNHKKVFRILNYIDRSFIVISTITGCVSISTCASLDGIPIRITSSAIGLKICTITAGIERYKPIIKKEKKKHDKVVLLAKSKSNSIEVLISKVLIDSDITHDKFVLIEKEIENSSNKQKFRTYINQYYLIV